MLRKRRDESGVPARLRAICIEAGVGDSAASRRDRTARFNTLDQKCKLNLAFRLGQRPGRSVPAGKASLAIEMP